VTIKSVEGTKLAEDVTSDSTVGFNATANIVESERNQDELTLKFTIELSTSPEVAKMIVSGTAVVSGDDKEIDSLLGANSGDSPPPVFMKIYQKVYAILYLVSGSLKIPYPSPGLLKGVRLVSSKEMAHSVAAPVRGPTASG
jgi:hypothetical protein